jgi:hypothetical protein
MARLLDGAGRSIAVDVLLAGADVQRCDSF